MPYGTIKVDNIIYTKGGVDTTITVSGIVDSLSGAISVTGSISGASVSAPTGTFTTLSGNTTAGTTATFVTGVFTTSLSGATITGNTGQFSNITGVSGVFTTRISGATITGNTGQFSSITGISGVFTSVSGTTFTVTSGVFASGTAAAPSVSVGTTTNGLYSSAANEVAVSTSGNSRLVVDASGNVNIDAGTFYVDAVNNRVGVGTTGPIAGTLIDAFQSLYPLINTRCNGNGAAGYGSSTDNQTNLWFFGARKDSIGGSAGTDRFNLLYNTNHLLTVDASGNLGIKNTSPTSYNASADDLVVGLTGDTGVTIVSGTSNQGSIFFADGTTGGAQQAAGYLVYLHSNDSMTLGTANTARLTIDSSGNLGIKNTSPTSYDASADDLVVGLTGDTGVTIVSGTSSQGSIFFADGTTGGAQQAAGYLVYLHSNDSMTLGTANTARLTIASDGLVGIGTTSPAYTLDVTGSVLQVGSSTDAFVQYKSTAGNWHVGANSSNAYVFYSGTYGSGSERARIDSSGRLLVGATSDSGGALLQVNGDRIRVGTAKTPASASDTGTTGEVCWDANYIYVCTATNTWKRSALSTW